MFRQGKGVFVYRARRDFEIIRIPCRVIRVILPTHLPTVSSRVSTDKC